MKSKSFSTWVIGIGNPLRRDDGIGPYIVRAINQALRHEKDVGVRIMYQLEPDLVEDVRHADFIVLVDAAMEDLKDGLSWVRVRPESKYLPYLTHHLNPSLFLGFFQLLYHRCPQTWLMSVQGCDFGLGEGLTSEAEKRSEEAISEILKFISAKKLDKKTRMENEKICRREP